MELAEAIYNVNHSAQSRADVISSIYHHRELKSSIIAYVMKHGGSNDEAKIVFDDTIVQFIKTAFSPNSNQLNGDLEPYLMGIAKFVWFGELRSKGKSKVTELQINSYIDESPSPDELYLTEERHQLLSKVLQKLRSNCREVLMHWANGFSMIEIAEKIGYQSEGMARKKKSQCIAELNEFLFQNPSIKLQLAP